MGKRTKVAASPIGEHLAASRSEHLAARSSSPTWETLRDWLRGKIRELMQGLLVALPETLLSPPLGGVAYFRRGVVSPRRCFAERSEMLQDMFA